MDQIRANTPAPIKANLITEQLSVQMSWGNGGCTHAGSPGEQQSRQLGPWAARRSRAMLRANAWGHDELITFHRNAFYAHEINGKFFVCMGDFTFVIRARADASRHRDHARGNSRLNND